MPEHPVSPDLKGLILSNPGRYKPSVGELTFVFPTQTYKVGIYNPKTGKFSHGDVESGCAADPSLKEVVAESNCFFATKDKVQSSDKVEVEVQASISGSYWESKIHEDFARRATRAEDTSAFRSQLGDRSKGCAFPPETATVDVYSQGEEKKTLNGTMFCATLYRLDDDAESSIYRSKL
ncbi:hypothetical protein I302_107026 [Kwoniella bestiolae CBS 10118]|uniref:Uncharacterized protein n=1 Tax=Kwoniella bestiolae CBS 10118 TaxID=1296100 RepID=A0A1B9FZR2_9TREE|nr:hypothetical protein I302_05710 [Kwoniella bestiolae CBS 10118]OCF24251.1 hypothetical protein I302_05710 [Kwoniella bestiolae CBS 10118]